MNFFENNIVGFTDSEIICGLTQLVKTERKVIFHILRFIHEVESRKIHLAMGYYSVMKYLVDHHKYSERSALRRVNAAKILFENPQVSEKVQNGEVKLSQLEMLQKSIRQTAKTGQVVTANATAEILNRIENLNMFETERVLVSVLNFEPKTFQKTSPQSDGSVRMEFTFTEEQFALFKKAQSYISHAVPSNDIAKAIAHLCSKQIQKVEGGARSKYVSTEKKVVHDATPCNGARPRRSQNSIKTPCRPLHRKYIRRSLKAKLLKESDFGCSHIHPESGRVCGSKFQLQVDHIIPFSRGGSDDESNFRILCGIHNRHRIAGRECLIHHGIT